MILTWIIFILLATTLLINIQALGIILQNYTMLKLKPPSIIKRMLLANAVIAVAMSMTVSLCGGLL